MRGKVSEGKSGGFAGKYRFPFIPRSDASSLLDMSHPHPGPGWWVASDGKWYPPEAHPSMQLAAVAAPLAHGPGWWVASDGKWYPPEAHPSMPLAAVAGLPTRLYSAQSHPGQTYRPAVVQPHPAQPYALEKGERKWKEEFLKFWRNKKRCIIVGLIIACIPGLNPIGAVFFWRGCYLAYKDHKFKKAQRIVYVQIVAPEEGIVPGGQALKRDPWNMSSDEQPGTPT
jgi:hypothetical protein